MHAAAIKLGDEKERKKITKTTAKKKDSALNVREEVVTPVPRMIMRYRNTENTYGVVVKCRLGGHHFSPYISLTLVTETLVRIRIVIN